VATRRENDDERTRIVDGYAGNSAHFRLTTDEVASRGYQEFTFR